MSITDPSVPKPGHLHLALRPTLLFLAFTDLYATLTILYLGLRLFFGDQLWPVALASSLIHWFLLPGFAALAILLAMRRWRRAALAAAPVIAFLLWFGGLFLPRLRPPAGCGNPGGDCRTLTVMTMNTGTVRLDSEKLAATLVGAGVDIVALQEVSTGLETALQEMLLEEYPHRVIYSDGLAGIGILSRYPIRDHELFHLELGVFPYLQATIDVEGRSLVVFSAHPPPPGFSQTQGYVSRTILDLPGLLERVHVVEPTLVMGDFNVTDQSDDYAMLARAGLTDSFREAGWGLGLTFPVWGRYRGLPIPALVRIDYVWTTDHFAVQRAWVGPAMESDHRPVLVELTW